MEHAQQFYIDGQWVDPLASETIEVVNPATEQPIATIALGGEKDVDRAVTAARAAFDGFASTSREERIALLERVIEVYGRRLGDLAQAISTEMGAPVGLANKAQAPSGLGHFMQTLEALKGFEFEEKVGTTTVVYEPVGVCAFITPWN